MECFGLRWIECVKCVAVVCLGLNAWSAVDWAALNA